MGMALSMDPGKLAHTINSVHPITIRILAASKKFQRFVKLTEKLNSGYTVREVTHPNRNTSKAPTRPMI